MYKSFYVPPLFFFLTGISRPISNLFFLSLTGIFYVSSKNKNLGEFSSKQSISSDTFFILVILVIAPRSLQCSTNCPKAYFSWGDA